LTFLATLIYLFIMLVILLFPVSEYFALLFKSKIYQFGMIVLPGTILAVVSYILSIFGLVVGFRSLQRDF
jgi:hypothetical protein